MTKEQKQIAMIVGMLPILGIALLSGLGRKKNKAVILPPAESLSAMQGNTMERPTPKLPADKSAVDNQKKRAEGPWGRDPFISETYKSGQANSELKLQGISFSKDKVGYAFINSEIVKRGDSIGGYEVAEILKDRVLLKKGSQSFYLAFPEE